MMYKVPVLLSVLLALSAGVASAEEAAQQCRLRGGTLVPLSAEACAKEGGRMVAPKAEIAPQELSADPKLAAAQRKVIELIDRIVMDSNPRKRDPEGVERQAHFDGCKLSVEETWHIDHGNVFTARKEFKIRSTVDMALLAADGYTMMGKLSSIAGGFEGAAVKLEEGRRSEPHALSITVNQLKEEAESRFSVPGPVAFWDAPRADLTLVDGYGYPKSLGMDGYETSRVRILYIMQSEADATALKQALDELRTACHP